MKNSMSMSYALFPHQSVNQSVPYHNPNSQIIPKTYQHMPKGKVQELMTNKGGKLKPLKPLKNCNRSNIFG